MRQQQYAERHVTAEYEDLFGSVPSSVRQIAHVDPPDPAHDARMAAAHAVAELARSSPESAALLMAGHMGMSGISRVVMDERHYVERRERKFLGMSLGEEFVPLTERRIRTETWRLF